MLYSSMNKPVVKSWAFILKHKLKFTCLCVFILLQISLYRTWSTPIDGPTLPGPDHLTLSASKLTEPLVYECCTPLNNSPRTNLYFLKTHKTGSSTLQSIILRFAKMNSLDIMNLKYGSYYWPISDFSIYPNSLTPNGKYHIMAQHVRYDSNLKSYQYPNTSMVTVLRHPATLFQSLYNYYHMYDSTGKTLEEFLEMPVKPPVLITLDSVLEYRGYNQMSVDLGFDITQSKNDTAVAEFIGKIDREFDLVLIIEHMEVSLVLLANLMGWPLEYVAHLNLNARLPASDAYTLTERDKNIIMDLNQVDTLLYFHFFNKFLKCIRQYGEDEMKQQIRRLRTVNEGLKQRCVNDTVIGDVYYGQEKIIKYEPKNHSDWECVYSMTVDFGLNTFPGA